MNTASARKLPPAFDIGPLTSFEILIARVFDAPPELVFRMWTEPRHFVRWLGPQGFTALSAELDVRPGGSLRASVRDPAGRVANYHGSYREVVEWERLVFTLCWTGNPRPVETLVTVTFAAGGGKTFMTFCQTSFTSVAARDGSYRAWSQEFDKLDRYLVSIESPRR